MVSMNRILKCGKYKIPIGERTLLMGVLNVTPDSFSDGGKYFYADAAVAQAIRMAEEGADIIDIGGESTRPGAKKVSSREELRRVLPVIEGLRSAVKVPLSIDTYKSEVARKAIGAGACIINDITALRGDRNMAEVAAEAETPVVLMHMKGTPKTMQKRPRYSDVVGEISNFLRERADFAIQKGIKRGNIIIDPGLGFGKRLEDNINIIRGLEKFRRLGYPVLVGPSRKSFIGAILGLPAEKRLEGTLAAVAACALNGADIIRVHDVLEAKRAVAVIDAITARKKNAWRKD
jgi:dihydropteroate synthase